MHDNTLEHLLNQRYTQHNLLFESDISRSWLDIYKYQDSAPELEKLDDNSLPYQSVENYLGRCDTPYTRIKDAAEFSCQTEASLAASGVEGMSSSRVFLMVRQRHSWSKLLITRELFDYALASVTSSKRPLDHVLSFGFRISDTDIGGPPLWFEPDLTSSSVASRPTLTYECAYTLKYMELNRRPDPERPWSERQSAVVMASKQNRWLLISASTAMQIALDTCLRKRGLCQASRIHSLSDSFAIHLALVTAVVGTWRPYLAYLTHETNEGVSKVIATDPDNPDFNVLTVEDRQRFRLIEDRVTDMLAMIDSTVDILSSLQEKYHIFVLGNDVVHLGSIRLDQDAFRYHESIRELELIRKQLDALHIRVQSSVQLLSSLLDLENGHSLRGLAIDSRNESAAMLELSKKASRDTEGVKVITIITLIYLPTTVVANFFSTQFVSNQSGGAGLVVEKNWWILAAVSIPLTLFTVGLWWGLQNRSTNAQKALLRLKGSKDRTRLALWPLISDKIRSKMDMPV